MSRSEIKKQSLHQPEGFTLLELLIGSTIMLIVIVAALMVYSKSNQISVDQQQYAAIQNDVRSAMYIVMRDMRMAGVGLPQKYLMYSLSAVDNEDQGSSALVKPDRLKIMGNIEFPCVLSIQNYQGDSANVSLADYSFEQYPYPDSFYDNLYVLVLPNPDSGCVAGEVRITTHPTHSTGALNEKLNFSPGLAPGVDPPGGLSGTCPDSNNYDGGYVMLVNVNEYWLDVTGSYPGLMPGVNGYLGIPGVFYVTKNGVHVPLAQNIENFQVQFNGDFDDTGQLNGFRDWDTAANGSPLIWTLDQVSRIRQVKVLLLGRTANAFVSVSGTPTGGIAAYRRPAMANSQAGTTNDMHRRFLLESASNIRNMSLNLYNQGER
jgi:prepilin-type N-terminal cleavage/methylation domain-containing protein